MGIFFGCLAIAAAIYFGLDEFGIVVSRSVKDLLRALGHDVDTDARPIEDRREARLRDVLSRSDACKDRSDELLAFVTSDGVSASVTDDGLLAHLETCEACGKAVDAMLGSEAEAIQRFADDLRKLPTRAFTK